ncbi:Integral membrane protein YggT, involved in response to extracytoplasmic stress (osmotic shock) [hydrothermal vent metagenome]|uniref:Integral membrane protein YggT, involved in response to extracytoplasmic stress (Osmotic shock) n=1 Tax=hydrothermal vent metagenome TaxID=652676 RepID=A0A1W1CNW8_9ZZZZ
MENLIIAPLHLIITIYIWVIIASAIFSFLQVDPRQPVVEVIERMTQPAFTFIRQKMPYVVISGVDLSPLVLLVGLEFLDNVLIGSLAFAILQMIHAIIFTFVIIIIIASVLSFMRVDPYNPIVASINRLTHPMFQWVHRKFPFLIISGIDLSPIAIIIALQLLDTFLAQLFVGL